jgi:hypothetical protein
VKEHEYSILTRRRRRRRRKRRRRGGGDLKIELSSHLN